MTNSKDLRRPTVVLLTTSRTYRARPFASAAERLGLHVLWGIDLPTEISTGRQLALRVDFRNQDQAVQAIVSMQADRDVKAILALDDAASLIAAEASGALGLPHNAPGAALAARDKGVMRNKLQASGIPCPRFSTHQLDANPATIAAHTRYPCVLKPTLLNGSQGVIRANTKPEFEKAWERVKTVIENSVGLQILVEDYLPGTEVAVEGLIHDDELLMLAIFDKPDTPDGPFFEETIYITPSRLSPDTQDTIKTTTAQGAHALGLRFGPVHAELRINERGVWPIEVAGRSIGGLCSQILRFGHGASLEDLILRQATGLPVTDLERETKSRGVMMIPIPERGLLRQVHGLRESEEEPGIDSVEISARLNYPLLPLPEGDSYLGFIFASGENSSLVEDSLRRAHAHLQFDIEPEIRLQTSLLG